MTGPAAVSGTDLSTPSPTSPSKPKPAKHHTSSTMFSTPNGGNDRKGKGPTTKRSYVSMDHLTNFQLPPRQQHPLSYSAPRRKKSSIAQQVWNKEKFVNAQYRFVMKPTEDYTVHFADPDIYFQWHDILQVIIPPSAGTSGMLDFASSELTSCPICLTSPPVAPRVTKCGHIFCFPCILRYLAQGKDPKWNRCPICFDSVTESHLKCVRWDSPSTPSYQELETPAAASSSASSSSSTTLKMRLVERPHITTMALPRSHFWPSDLLPPHQAPFHFLPDVQTFAKFMLATPAYLISNLSLELEQLEQEKRLLSGPFQDDIGLNYVSAAEEKVRQQMGKAAALEDANPGLGRSIDNARKLMEDMEKQHESREKAKAAAAAQRKDDESATVSETPSEMLAVQSQGGFNASSSTPTPTPTPRGPKPRKNVNPAPPPSASSYFFYQAANGAPLFLHPLDSRILLSHFKSWSDLPDEIEFPTTTVSYIASTINDEVRKRYKYLSHLPEAADVVFVETGWELEAIVGTEGLKAFEGALKLRHGKRKEKERKEERAKVTAEERERDSQLRELSTWIGGGYARGASPQRMEREESPSPPPPPLPSSRSSQTQAQTPQTTGVWGNRSFASAIRAPATPSNGGAQGSRQRNNNREEAADDEWEHAIDEAWRELEMSSLGKEKGGGRGKKKGGGGKKLVILSGGGSGRGRY